MVNKTKSAILHFDKMTKNKVRYREPGSEVEGGPQGMFPVVYIRQAALLDMGATRPDRVKVTVEVLNSNEG